MIFHERYETKKTESKTEKYGVEDMKSELFDLLGKHKRYLYVRYEEAREINIENNISCPDEYYEFCKKDIRLRENPEEYKGFNWLYFLGISHKYYSLEECKQKVKYYFTKIEMITIDRVLQLSSQI